MKTLKLITLGMVLAVVSVCAEAYESDFHFGLTWWLAKQAGFDARQSQEIARQNELTDTGMLDAKHAMVWGLCIWRDTEYSTNTRAMHFRSKQKPPADPAERRVTEDAVYAEAQARSIIYLPHHEDPETQGLFGQALHGRQDAYSHAGQSNTFAPLCPSLWFWSHPIDKGGVFSHDADRTFMAPDKCERAALKTYDLLLQFRAPLSLGSTARKPEQISAPVKGFCRAKTKFEKARWFKEQGVPQGEAIAKNTSLEDGGGRFFTAARMDLRPDAPSINTLQADVPEYEDQEPGWLPPIEIDVKVKEFLMNASLGSTPEAQAFSQQFLKAWLTSPPEKLRATIEPYWGKKISSERDADLIRLLRLRLKDQGQSGQTRFDSGIVNPDEYVTFNNDNWSAALVPVRGSKAPALVGERGKSIVVIAILRNAPNEVLVIEISPDYESVNIQSLIFH
ncbi:hypothetical protein AUC61_07640 [Pseudomonas sp. S25]|uniref:Uncharacterized protein n=1 Tax=Pseudomonas maioricensis TaxID=1766623 RepID=A0ABS9ZFV4_9PSED|nr:hypothetical protein [Pseudomonas sp. S25]MCI8209405.1 hypothetical protein [Pseudomonas sp. S25]